MLTDDADRGDYAGCAPFLANEDYDPMYEGPGHDTPKCGGPSYVVEGREQWNEGCPGCRHCFAPDPELQPYGFGIERFESAAVYRLLGELKANAVVLGMRRGDFLGPVWFQRALEWTGFNFRLERVAERVWLRLCDTCETHPEAVEKYTAWAKKVTKTA